MSESQQQQPQSEQTQIVEASTGQIAQPRSMEIVDQANLDPRFDRDDLRQGHPPPAAKKYLKKVKVRRSRSKKGTPYNPNEALNNQEKELEAEMTEEEVEVEDLPQESHEEEKKPGLLGKILGKDKESEKE